MSIICPTVLADNPHLYREQIERIAPFAKRIQIDLSDGEFTSPRTVNAVQAWWPDGVAADIHLMHKQPGVELETLIGLNPHMVIIHAEARGNLEFMLRALKKVEIRTGLALLQNSQPEDFSELISLVDHVLIFGGNLGSFGGQADLSQLDKIGRIKEIAPDVEIGWDGGAHEDNVKKLADSGVDVINVGGYIQHAPDPEVAYEKLSAILEKNA